MTNHKSWSLGLYANSHRFFEERPTNPYHPFRPSGVENLALSRPRLAFRGKSLDGRKSLLFKNASSRSFGIRSRPEKQNSRGRIICNSVIPRGKLTPLIRSKYLMSLGSRLKSKNTAPAQTRRAQIATAFGYLRRRVIFRPTSQVSHDPGWRGACASTTRDSWGRCAVAPG